MAQLPQGQRSGPRHQGPPDQGHARASRTPRTAAPVSLGVGLPALAALMLGATYFVGSGAGFLLIAALTPLVLLVGLGPERAGTLLIRTGFFLAPWTSLVVGHGNSTATDVLLFLGFLLLSPGLLRRRLYLPVPYAFGILVLIVMSLLSIAVHGNPVTSMLGLAHVAFAMAFIPIGLLLWRPDRTEIGRLASCYIAGCVASVGNGLLQGPTDGSRYDGATNHPNAFGLSLVLALTLTPVAVRAAQRHRWLLIACAPILFYGIWISGSRAALVALVIVGLLYVVVEQSTGMLGLGLAGGIAGLLVASQLATRNDESALGRLLGGQNSTDSDIERIKAFNLAVHQFLDHPYVGSGFENIRHAHNIYLQMAASLGIFATLGFSIILATMCFAIFMGPRPRHQLAYPALAFAVTGPLTDIIWDAMIWAPIALALLAVPAPDEEPWTSTPDPEPAA